jgi:hypothetical protein
METLHFLCTEHIKQADIGGGHSVNPYISLRNSKKYKPLERKSEENVTPQKVATNLSMKIKKPRVQTQIASIHGDSNLEHTVHEVTDYIKTSTK